MISKIAERECCTGQCLPAFVKLYSGLGYNKVRKMLKSHLDEVRMSYFAHLGHAWRLGFILLVHGLMPWIWSHKVRDEICAPS